MDVNISKLNIQATPRRDKELLHNLNSNVSINFNKDYVKYETNISEQQDLHFINAFSRNNVLTSLNCARIMSGINLSDEDLEEEVMENIIGEVDLELLFGKFYDKIISFPSDMTMRNPIVALLDAPSTMYVDLKDMTLKGRINYLDPQVFRIRFKDRTIVKLNVKIRVR